jgi:hypothetical protein
VGLIMGLGLLVEDPIPALDRGLPVRAMVRRNFEGWVVRCDSENAIGLSGGDRHVGAAGP